MQDRIEIVAANDFTATPQMVRAIAKALERFLKARLSAGEYVVVNGMVREAPK